MRDSSNSALFWKRSAVYPRRVCNLLIVREKMSKWQRRVACMRGFLSVGSVRTTRHSRAGGNPQGLGTGSESETTHLSLL